MKLDLKLINEDFEKFILSLDESLNKNNIRKAFEFAKKAHIFQNRFTGEPYISHPLAVAKLVIKFGLGETSLISAILHDVIEDTSVKIEEIKKEFGTDVADIVEALSKIETFGNDKIEKNIESLRKILLASSKDIRILIIKLCDRLHNMRTLEKLPNERRERIANETLLIYVPIAQKVGISPLKSELEDLSFKYLNPEMYKFISNKINLKKEERENQVKKIVLEIKKILNDCGYRDNILIIGRPKSFYSIYKKIKDKSKTFEDINDIYAIRIITKTIEDCYTILGIIHDKFYVFPNHIKDYIATPKSNGYQSLHSLIFSKTMKMPIEVQIRTESMHKLAEFGIAAHWKYKNLKEDKKFEKKIGWLREVLQWEKEHKDSYEFLSLLKFDFFDNEIFVFTPKNKVIILPEKSSALDFAYTVHTEIGNHALKAKINGVTKLIEQELKSGDIIEIMTHKNSRPTEKWLKFVKTSKAISKIKDYLNLKHTGKIKISPKEITTTDLKSMMTRIDKFKKVRFAGCCHFEYKEQIVGVVSKEGELVIHNASCENAKFSLNKKIPINWKNNNISEIILTIYFKDRFGIVMDILNIFSGFNLNISKLNTKVLKDGSVNMNVTFLNGPYIEDLIKKIKKLESVTNCSSLKKGFLSNLLINL